MHPPPPKLKEQKPAGTYRRLPVSSKHSRAAIKPPSTGSSTLVPSVKHHFASITSLRRGRLWRTHVSS